MIRKEVSTIWRDRISIFIWEPIFFCTFVINSFDGFIGIEFFGSRQQLYFQFFDTFVRTEKNGKQKIYNSLSDYFFVTAIITELLRKRRLVVDNVIHCFHLPVLLHFYNFEDRSIFFSGKWSEKTSLQSDGKEMKSLSGNLFFFYFSKMSSPKMTVLIKLCDVIAL